MKPVERRGTTCLIALLVVLAPLISIAPAVSAHFCKARDHGGCASHHCPNDGQSHEHIHDVRWWPDHYCRSHPQGAALSSGLVIETAEYGIILDQVPCTDHLFDNPAWIPTGADAGVAPERDCRNAGGDADVGPKLYCEPSTEWKTHRYLPPATGRLLWGFSDGNLDDCDGDFDPTNPVCWAEEANREDVDGDGDVCEAFDYDLHAESSGGGSWILSCNELCGDDGLGNPGSGSAICFGEAAHHASLPVVSVRDSSGLTGIEFRVAADTTSLTGPDPVDGTVCGDFRSDFSQICFDVCVVTFPPGLDGSYQVYVLGTAGEVNTS